MFDVLWTDPNRELVGERKIRKELEAQNKEKEKKQAGVNRQSTSASSSSSSERSFGLFSGKARKKASTPSKQATDEPRSQRVSGHGVKALLSHEDYSAVTVKPASSSNVTHDNIPEASDGSLSLSSRGMWTVFAWAEQTTYLQNYQSLSTPNGPNHRL